MKVNPRKKMFVGLYKDRDIFIYTNMCSKTSNVGQKI